MKGCIMPLYFIDDSNCLEHYGVMGMKWGIRKDRNSKSGPKHKRYSARQLARMSKGISKDRAAVEARMASKIGDVRSDQTKLLGKNMRTALDQLNRGSQGFPDETPEYRKAANKAANEFIQKELKRAPEAYNTPRLKQKLEEYAYADLGHPAGWKAFEKAYPDWAKKEKAFDKAFEAYSESVHKDAEKVLKKNADVPVKELRKKYPSYTYERLIYDILYDME